MLTHLLLNGPDGTRGDARHSVLGRGVPNLRLGRLKCSLGEAFAAARGEALVQNQARPLGLAGLINRVHRVLQGVSAEVAERNDLFVGELDAIAALGGGGNGMRMGDMARAMLVSAPNATRIVKQLEDRGLAQRGPSAKSDREVIVRLTVKGEDAFRACLPQLETELQGALDSALLDGEQDQLYQLLRKLGGPVP